MIQTHRTIDQLLSNSFTGPATKLQVEGLELYKKSPSSKESNQSKNSEKNQEINEDKISQMALVVQERLSEIQSDRYLCSRNSDSCIQRISKIEGNKEFKQQKNLYKAMKKTFLIGKFKKNLFTTSNILQMKYKQNQSLYQYSLLEKSGCRFQQSLNNIQYLWNIQQILRCLLKLAKIPYNKDHIALQLNSFIKNNIQYSYLWEGFSLFMQLFKLWYCPFIISFGSYDHSLKGIEIFIIVFIIFDFIFVKTFNQYLNQEINDQTKIQQQERNDSIKKTISVVFWTLIYLEYSQIIILREIIGICIVTFILQTIQKKYEKIVEKLFLQGINLDLLDLFTLLIQIVLFTHIISCIWHYIGEVTYQSYGSWLEIFDIINQSAFVKYNYSLYWATTTIATVGYGDITPKNQIEIIFTTFVMLISSCMFAYSINSIGLIVNGIYQSNQKRALALINSYMKNQEIDFQLQNRVRNFFKFNHEKEIIENYDITQQLINSLPIGLQSELKQDVRSKIMNRITMFQRQFSKATNDQVSQVLSSIKVTPQEIIYLKDNQIERNLYFIATGEVKLIDEQSKRLLKTAQAGEIFGEYQFFTNQNSRETAICSQFAELYRIERDIFLNIIKQNGKDFQRFYKIKDLITFKQDYSFLQKNCQICQEISHNSLDCPLTRRIPNLYITILKSNFSQVNQRDKCLRNFFKFRSLVQNNLVVDSMYEFQKEHSYSIQSSYNDNQNPTEPYIYDDNSIQLQLEEQLGGLCESCKSIQKKKLESQAKLKTTERNIYPQRLRKSTIKTDIKFQVNKNNISNDNLQLKLINDKYFSDTINKFDKHCSYSEYFPHYNIQNIIRQISHLQQQKNVQSYKVPKFKKGKSNFVP